MMVFGDPRAGTAGAKGSRLGDCPMRGFRAAMTSVSTTWAAADHSRIARALKITASVLTTMAVVALASFVAVALSLTDVVDPFRIPVSWQ